jgi:phosphatidylethanolamine-binding protein (PEBP) family uncharacterized protein
MSKVFLVLVVVVCLQELIAIPTAKAVVDPEIKPTIKDSTKGSINSKKDDYDNLSAPWAEKKVKGLKPTLPQTGSLISIEQAKVEDVVAKDPTKVVVPMIPPPVTVSEVPLSNSQGAQIEKVEGIIPIKYNGDPAAILDIKSSSDWVAPPPVVDPKLKSVHGIDPAPVQFLRPEDYHPMELKTPLIDPFPCDPDRILAVTIPAAQLGPNQTVAELPRRYGCSSDVDGSREKASPEITWTNVSEDVYSFSLQMIEMGDGCSGTGPDFGKIYWHVNDIKMAPTVTLQEGASHDSRMLFGGKEQPNQYMEEYYSGPCPMKGTTGCYRFKVLGHRTNGRCQCGYVDVTFSRPAAPIQWYQDEPVLAPIGAKKQQ